MTKIEPTQEAHAEFEALLVAPFEWELLAEEVPEEVINDEMALFRQAQAAVGR